MFIASEPPFKITAFPDLKHTTKSKRPYVVCTTELKASLSKGAEEVAPATIEGVVARGAARSTLIEEVWTGTGTNRMKEKQGGQVFAAGSASVLGLFHPAFDQVMGELASVQAVQASAGFAHSGVVTSDMNIFKTFFF